MFTIEPDRCVLAVTEIDTLPGPILSPNLIFEDRRKVKQVMSFVVQQDSRTSPLTKYVPLKRGRAYRKIDGGRNCKY